MTLTAPPTNRIRGYGPRGSIIPTVEVTALTAPTVTLAQVTGRALSATITDLDPHADGVELQLDENATPSTLVASYFWTDIEVYNTGDIGDGATRYARSRSYSDTTAGRIYSDWSSIDSETTASSVPAPGAVIDLLMVNNGDGTADFSWSLPDAYGTTLKVQIWVQSSTSWLTLVDLDSTPTATSATGISVPGSTGATVNGSDEFGVRLLRTNGTGSSVSNEQWLPITDVEPGLTAAVLGSVVSASSSSLRIPLTTPPTNYTSIELLRSTSGQSSGGTFSAIAGVDSESDFASGGYLDTGRSASTAYFYILRAYDSEGGFIDSNEISGTTQASGGGGAALFDDNFATGNLSLTQNGFSWGGTTNVSVVSRGGSISGNAARFRYNNSVANGGTGVNENRAEMRFLYPFQTDVWVAIDLEIPSNYSHGSVSASGGTFNNKFLGVWDGDTTDGNLGYSKYYTKTIMEVQPDGDKSKTRIIYGTSNAYYSGFATSSWNGLGGSLSQELIDPATDAGEVRQFVLHFKPDNVAGTGGPSLTGGSHFCEIWKDGTLIQSQKTLRCGPHSSNPAYEVANRGYRFGYVFGAANAKYNDGSGFVDFYLHRFRMATSNIFGVSS